MANKIEYRCHLLTLLVLTGFATCSGCKFISSSKLTEDSPSAVTRHPAMVLIGGGNYHQNNDDILNKFLGQINANQASGHVAYIGIVTAASDPVDVQADGAFYEKMFGEHQVKAEWLDLDRAAAESAFAAAMATRVATMDGFFFGGGNQANIDKALYIRGAAVQQPTTILTAMRTAFSNGAVYAGTSAGSVISTGVQIPILLSGGNYVALTAIPYSTNPDDVNHDPNYDKLVIGPNGGLGFFPFGSIDTHFNERNRAIRGLPVGRLLQEAGTSKGSPRIFGVDEGTAMIVTDIDQNNPQINVVGKGGVTIIDFQNANFQSTPCVAVTNVALSYLTLGDSYSPVSGTFSLAANKGAVTPNANLTATLTADPLPSADNGATTNSDATAVNQNVASATPMTPDSPVPSAFFGSPTEHLSGTDKSPAPLRRAFAAAVQTFILSKDSTIKLSNVAGTSPNFTLTLIKSKMNAVQDTSAADSLVVSYTNLRADLSCVP